MIHLQFNNNPNKVSNFNKFADHFGPVVCSCRMGRVNANHLFDHFTRSLPGDNIANIQKSLLLVDHLYNR